ncbi:LOW QUALITY PROTEIN: hypothetical protein BC938DRAFT_481333 [Jimgerdemannia flammicorona]|uniref:Uncharacterized protein n=1 Tax=Jimgerdemannia flammicorona TaxID=994334 RepID=A0A433QGI5_9FUNG|nr:LOW QUALITY PROTEIN: hypothetical protein BC938DRAFT_481333 [Jimgerdemannia flammicorona]
MSVLNFAVTRNSEYTAPVKSKVISIRPNLFMLTLPLTLPLLPLAGPVDPARGLPAVRGAAALLAKHSRWHQQRAQIRAVPTARQNLHRHRIRTRPVRKLAVFAVQGNRGCQW